MDAAKLRSSAKATWEFRKGDWNCGDTAGCGEADEVSRGEPDIADNAGRGERDLREGASLGEAASLDVGG